MELDREIFPFGGGGGRDIADEMIELVDLAMHGGIISASASGGSAPLARVVAIMRSAATGDRSSCATIFERSSRIAANSWSCLV